MAMALSVFLTAAALCGCDGAGGGSGSTGKVSGKEPLTIWTATDIHYLSSTLADNGELFKKVMLDGDAKLTEHAPEIVDEFFEEVISAKPDALVITGDLTFNGEIVSLRELAEKLREVQNAGIPVLVIPGNHDIDSYRAYSYSGSEVEYTENISKEEFREICRDFGISEALSAADDSFSYVYAVSDDTWIMTIDANTQGAGRVTDETLKWAEEQLKKAQKNGITVITATHQSVLAQNKRMVFGYIISNHEEVEDLLRNYGVKLNLSGHVHMQHTAAEYADGSEAETGGENAVMGEDGVLTDIATGSMTVAALRYGIVELDENRDFTYTMASVNTMREEAEERFKNRTHKQVAEALENISAAPEEKAKMAEFAEDINYKFFTGVLPEDYFEEHSEGIELWRKYGKDTFWLNYIESMQE